MGRISRRKSKLPYTGGQKVIITLICICGVCLLALGAYFLTVFFAENPISFTKESNQTTQPSISETESKGVGRDSAALLTGADTEDADKGNIVGVDENGDPVQDEPTLPIITRELSIHSTKAILIDRETGEVIYSLDPDKNAYPASLTKIMTAVLALESGISMDTNITLTAEMLDGLSAADASVVGFMGGETVTFQDLLYGLMLPSGADAATALAITCSGSTEAFVAQMNAKAKELGMTSTTYTNVHGLHDVKMKTTAQDMALLYDYALDNEAFREIELTHSYSMPVTDQHPDGIETYSTLSIALGDDWSLDRGEILGGKTGTTTPAGQCLASFAQVDGREYVLVTLGAFGAGNGDHFNADDARTIYNAIPKTETSENETSTTDENPTD